MRSGESFSARSCPITASHCVMSCASPKPRLPSAAPAMRGISAPKARKPPRRFSTEAPLYKDCGDASVSSILRRMPAVNRPQKKPHRSTANLNDYAARLCLVRPSSPRSAVARAARRACRSVSRLAQRDHAAADHGRDRRSLFRPIPGALARCRALAPAAKLDEVLHAWQGLGYYARARNLHACAQASSRVTTEFPGRREAAATPAGHRRLYRGGDRGDRLRPADAAPVDGNVERVVARLFAERRRRCPR